MPHCNAAIHIPVHLSPLLSIMLLLHALFTIVIVVAGPHPQSELLPGENPLFNSSLLVTAAGGAALANSLLTAAGVNNNNNGSSNGTTTTTETTKRMQKEDYRLQMNE